MDGFNTIIKAIFDFAMFWQFLQLLRYFLKIRNERSNTLALKVTLFNKFIIGSTIFFFLLCVYQSITFVHTYISRTLYGDFLHQDVWLYYTSFLFYIVFPFRDLFICSFFAYLYYYQGMKKEKKNIDPNREFNTKDLKDLLNREISLNMTGKSGRIDTKQSYSHIYSNGNQLTTEEGAKQPRSFKEVRIIQPLRNDYDLNPSIDNGNNKVEERLSFFKNE